MKITFENDDKDLLMRGIAKFIDTGFVSRLEAAVKKIRRGRGKGMTWAEKDTWEWCLSAICAAFPELKED